MMKYDVGSVFNILYTFLKFQKTFKNNNLLNGKRELEQKSNELTHWDYKLIKHQSKR